LSLGLSVGIDYRKERVMCTQIYFKDHKKIVSGIGELAEMLGGFDKLSVDPADYPDLADLEANAEFCLCPVDVEKALTNGGFYFTQWEDGVDYTAWEPSWVVEERQRKADMARYEAAMAEARAAQVGRHPEGGDGLPAPVSEAN
jgi:hypothetical protein